MKSNTKSWDKILEQQIMSSKMTFSVNPQSSKGLSSVANQITSQSYTYNSPEVKWLQLDKSKINNSADSKIMSLAIQLKEYENSGHMNVRMQLKALAAQALHEAGYPNDYTIDDYMRANGMLPPLQEDPEMIRQLQRQITEMQEASRQRDVLLEQINQNNLQLIQGLTEAEHIINEKDEIIAERDNTIELQANQLQESNNIIGERDNTILQLQGEKHDLTEQVGFLTEEKLDLTQKLQNEKVLNLQITEENEKLTEKFAISELKVVPLQEKVAGLEHFNKTLEHDKEMLEIDKKILQDDKKVLQEYNIEIREDKKMMVEYNKSLQDEKKLLLVDKKYFQDLSFEQALKIADLSQVHCNIPDHYEIIKMTGAGSNIPQNDND